jgi:hypothetical protein
LSVGRGCCRAAINLARSSSTRFEFLNDLLFRRDEALMQAYSESRLGDAL